MPKSLIPIAALGLVAGAAQVAQSDDLNPPSWYGEPLSVRAEWDWLTAPANLGFMPPDAFETVSGTKDPDVGPSGETLYQGFETHAEVGFVVTSSTADLNLSPCDAPDDTRPDAGHCPPRPPATTGPSDDWQWVMGDGDGGLTPMVKGLAMAFNVQNWVDDEPEKLIRIQLTYQTVPGATPMVPSINYMLGIIEPSGDQFQGEFVNKGGDNGYHYEDWIIEPNPDWEQISVNVPLGTILDQVVIHTISIPTPGTLALLAAVPLIFARRIR